MPTTIRTKQHRFLVKSLIAARRKAGLSQTKAAKKLGRSQTYIARIETGQRRVDAIELLEIARLYRFNVGKLLKQVERACFDN